MLKFKEFELKNGLRGVVIPVEGLNSVTVEVFFKIGSKYETAGEFGMSHFLEHMAFKGTKKRPRADLINKEIDSKGAGYNAGTGHEETSYYITTVRENVSWALEMLSDILTNSLYDEKEVLKERGVIMEEIRMYQDNPMMGLSGKLTKFLYGKSKIGCWDITGSVEDIEKVDQNRVISFRNKFVNPKEMVVVIAGNVGFEAVNEVKKHFESFSNSKKEELPEVKLSLNEKNSLVIKRDVEQGHFAMAVPGLAWTDERKYGFKLLDIILNGNSSSRLYQKIREEKALAYYVFSISESFKEGGFWGIQSGVTLSRLDEAMEIVRKELIKVSDDVNEEELERAKNYLIGKTRLAMDRSNYISHFVGSKMLLENKVEMIDREIERYKKIDLKEVKKLAGELFRDKKVKEVVISNK